jgi:acyl-coenzyme A synthetase/AMP-(fatty) acid ligase
MRITRDIIRNDIAYEDYTYEALCSHINRWKNLFLSKGAKKGDLIALAILEMNHVHISAIFAIAELGMKLLVIDKPVTYETMHMTKMALFGPVDFALECNTAASYPWHHEMVERYSKQIINEDEWHEHTDDSDSIVNCSVDDKFLLASTSGTTSTSKPVWFTHGEIFQISQRNIAVFKFEEDSHVLHTRNMHHASSLLTFLFPALMASKNHYYAQMFNKNETNSFATICQEHIIPKQIDRILCGNMFDVAKLTQSLKDVDGKIPKTLLMNMSGFTVTKSLVDLVYQYDVEIMSHYGSIDTGIPLLINHITKEYQFEESRLGTQPDQFYTMQETDGVTTITCSMWDAPRTIQDALENKNGVWYYGGRLQHNPIEKIVSEMIKDYTFVRAGNSTHLVIWDNSDSKLFDDFGLAGIHYLDKEQFTVDTKINMDQLREYVRCTFGK